MYRTKITLEKALELESTGEIMIVDTSKQSDQPKWSNNFQLLREKAPNTPVAKLLDYFSAKYIIEVEVGCTNEDTQTYEWKYFYGIENPKTNNSTISDSKLEYVYCLTNKGYPDLVKIGMTTKTPERRVEQINGTGTVDLWELKFALPVKQGTAFDIEQQVHKYFASQRLHVRNQNDREMFKVNIFEAMDKVRELGELVQAGKPILF